jgi:hypothetical protein
MTIDIKSRHAIPAVALWKFPNLLWTLFLIGIGTSTFWFIASRVLMLENHVLTNAPSQIDRMVAFNELVRECQEVQFQRYGKSNPLGCKTWANTKIRVYDNL